MSKLVLLYAALVGGMLFVACSASEGGDEASDEGVATGTLGAELGGGEVSSDE